MATKKQYQSVVKEHSKAKKTHRIHFVSERQNDGTVRYWTHNPDGSGDNDLESTEFYDAVIEAMALHPNADLISVSN